jgi:hypothetical protein
MDEVLLASPQTEEVIVWTIAPERVEKPSRAAPGRLSNVEAVMALGKARGWQFWVAGPGKMIASPETCHNRWTVSPLEGLGSSIPFVAHKRVFEAISAAGDGYEGLVIAHEPVPEIKRHTDPAVLICVDSVFIGLYAWLE